MKKSQLLAIAKDQYDENQITELAAAIDMATRAHAGQKRKSGEPYIIHPLAVAATLIDWGMDIDTVLAGVLHDTVEDTNLTLPEIENQFGRDVAFLVDGVTKISQARAGMREIDSYLPQTKDNLTKLLVAVGQDVRVIIIKLADRLHNLQTLRFQPPDKQRKIARESLEVFAPLADRLNMGRVRVQIEEISFSYLAPTRFQHLRKEMKRRLGRASKKLDHVRETVKTELRQNDITFTMDGRVKSVYSLHKKLGKVDDIDAIYDLIALRIIVADKNTCYQVLGILHALYKPMFERIKDYIAMPKQNGYQSLHTTVITPEKQIVEFQIRTEQMHEYAERGLAASFHYNEQKLTDAYRHGHIAAMPADLHWIRELQEVAAKLRAGENADVRKMKINLFSDRIFVYTPRGDIFDLPDDALPLDFAYRVHSDIGKNAHSFKVNGRGVSFDTPLKSGDVVEVITRRNVKPNSGWLSRIRTPHARNKIRAQLKKMSTSKEK